MNISDPLEKMIKTWLGGSVVSDMNVVTGPVFDSPPNTDGHKDTWEQSQKHIK